MDAWIVDYNTVRPHQALEMAVPAERFGLRPLAPGGASVPVETSEAHAGQWVLRRVAANGVVSVDSQMFSVGNAFKAELVDGRFLVVEEELARVLSVSVREGATLSQVLRQSWDRDRLSVTTRSNPLDARGMTPSSRKSAGLST